MQLLGGILALFFGSCVFCSAQSVDEAAVARDLFTDTNTSFEFAGRDRRSVRFISALSQELEVSSRSLLKDEEYGYPSKIFVALRPKAEASTQKPYVVTVGERGLVRIDFIWDEALNMEQVCLGLAEAYLTRYIYFRLGPEASGPPQWVTSAVGRFAYLRLRPSVIVDYTRSLRALETLDLTQVINGSDANENNLWGYWFLVGVRELKDGSRLFKRLADEALLGGDPQAVLQRMLDQMTAPDVEALSADDWWRGLLEQIRSANLNVYEPLRTSREWIGALSSVRGIEIEGGKKLSNLKDLWSNRNSAEVRSLIEARRQIILLRIGQVNPAYYNSAMTLGAFFETVLSGEFIADNVSALVDFLGEFEDTKRLESTVGKALEADAI